MYFYASTPPSAASDFASITPPPWVSLYRVDCASSASKGLCYEEGIEPSTLPLIRYYAGPGPGETWSPEVKEFDGKLFIGAYELIFFDDFLRTGPLHFRPCGLDPSRCEPSEVGAASSLAGLGHAELGLRALGALRDVDRLRAKRVKEADEGVWSAMTTVELAEAEIVVKAARVAWDKMKK